MGEVQPALAGDQELASRRALGLEQLDCQSGRAQAFGGEQPRGAAADHRDALRRGEIFSGAGHRAVRRRTPARSRPGSARAPAVAVAVVGRDHQRALASDLHALEAFVPAADDLLFAEVEGERFAAVERTVEFFAMFVGDTLVVQPAGVMHGDLAAGHGFGTGAGQRVDAFECGDAATRWRAGGGAASGQAGTAAAGRTDGA